MTAPEPPPEFHRPLAVLRLASGPHSDSITATPAECAALAIRMGLPSIASLVCAFTLHPRPAGQFLAEGRLRARITQTCVVSLEDFTARLDEHFRVVFAPADLDAADDDPESDDVVPYAGTAIDLGEAAAEQLALMLDPYPRKPDASIAPVDSDITPASPFAALARLRKPPS